MVTISCFLVIIAIFSAARSTPITSADNYNAARAQLIADEQCMRVGGNNILNANENIVNQFIMKEKRQIMDNSRLNRTLYIPAVSFFKSKPWIESTSLFKILQKMPKGAALHLHDTAIGSLDWVVSNATYWDNVYMCYNMNYIRLSVFQDPPNNPACPWLLVKTERSNATNITEFDLMLKRNISMLTTDPLVSFPDVNTVWDRFNEYFNQILGILSYAPIAREYYRQALSEFRADNVQYIEVRAQMKGLYELNGTVHNTEYALNMYKQVTEEFVQMYPDSSGAKFILSSLRMNNNSNILQDVITSMDLYKRYPNYFLGFDLVGQEDPSHPLLYYIDTLLYPSQQSPPVYLPYYFHAGETNWQGTDVDYNLVDALLLNTTRIGHGYGLVKHPKLIEMVKTRGVAIEVNPLSNQLLGLVTDLRNHAMAPLIAQDIPVIVSSDDPSVWEATPLSHDFYVAFMDLTGEDSDLSTLKQLCKNSIQYSGMNAIEKNVAMVLWHTKWDTFIKDTITTWNLVADSTIG